MTDNSEVKRILQELFDDVCNRTHMWIVPDEKEPLNINKARVCWYYDDPYAGLYIHSNHDLWAVAETLIRSPKG